MQEMMRSQMLVCAPGFEWGDELSRGWRGQHGLVVRLVQARHQLGQHLVTCHAGGCPIARFSLRQQVPGDS